MTSMHFGSLVKGEQCQINSLRAGLRYIRTSISA